MANSYFPGSPRATDKEYVMPNNASPGPGMNMLHPGEHIAQYYQHTQNAQQQQPQQLDAASPIIDPLLNHDPQPMQRYLAEPNPTYFSTPPVQGGRDATYLWGRVDNGSAYLPVGTAARHGSPFRQGSPFSQHFSATSSGALSPPADSDRYLDNAGPPTPPDMLATSPFMNQLSYDQTGHGNTQFHLTGLMGPNNNSCVDPTQVNAGSEHSGFDMSDQHDSFVNIPSMVNGAGMRSQSDSAIFAPPFMAQLDASEDPQQAYAYAHNPHLSLPTTPNYADFDGDEQRVVDRSSPMHVGHSQNHRASRSPSTSHGRPTGVNTDKRSRRRRSPATKPTRPLKNTSAPAAPFPPRGIIAAHNNGTTGCPQCENSFKDDAALQKHIKTQHNRPFICYFQYAGCSSTFATKNEWKRHVVSQHLALNYWLCTHGECARTTGPSTHKRSISLPTHGCIFNRKDLYTQHVRRMHAPAEVKRAMKNKKAVPMPEWDEQLKNMQEAAQQERCQLPSYMTCPVSNCGSEFRGKTAWDDRMEHVARHLERAVAGEEAPVQFGGDSDPSLTRWAESPEVAVVQRTANGGWELSNPLKGDGSPRCSSGEYSNEDAEGEDV
jgi:uncharacterized C2H2 Zn-finger protein